MTATEAKARSENNAANIQKAKDEEALRVAAYNVQKKIDEHNKWRDDLLKGVRSSIEYAVANGRNTTSHTLLSSERDRSSCYDKYFLENFEYGNELKSVIRKLEDDGYTVSIEGSSYDCPDYTYDGDCNGSHWVYSTLLVVRW